MLSSRLYSMLPSLSISFNILAPLFVLALASSSPTSPISTTTAWPSTLTSTPEHPSNFCISTCHRSFAAFSTPLLFSGSLTQNRRRRVRSSLQRAPTTLSAPHELPSPFSAIAADLLSASTSFSTLRASPDDDDLDSLMSESDEEKIIDGNNEPVAKRSSSSSSSSSGKISSSNSSKNVKNPFQTDGGVIMPEGGANPCVIKVLGIGGGGGNAVNRMIQTRITGVSFWAVNTDAQALAKSLAPNVLNIGRQITRGLGAGGVPSVGQKSALENAKEIEAICRGADMIFITAGMGGGTGSGAGPVVAEIAREMGCLTVGVVTKPFAFEGKKRMQQAEDAIRELRKHVDTLIVVSNDKLLRIVPENTPVTDAFLVADDILRQGVVGISEIIIKTGLVNVDFADVRAVMKDAGTALMGVGTGVGKTRATDAAVAAISSPLLDFPISEAKRIVFNVVGGSGLGLSEINAASEVIYENAHEDANIIFGALIDPEMGEEVSITVLACDFREDRKEEGEGAMARVAVAGMARNGEGEYRSPDFYKERRQMTRSPLGPDASLEETRTAITRGFKKPEPVEPVLEKKSFGKRMGGFFKRFGRKSD